MTPKEIIQKFDNISLKKFDELDLRTELKKFTDEGKGDPSPEVLSELLAFSFQENNPNSDGHGLYFGSMMTWKDEKGSLIEFPSLDKVTPEMIQYWTQRAKESINPILINRYSGLVWEFQAKVSGSKPSQELCRLNVKSILDISHGDYCKHEVYCLKKLERALSLAIEINDVSLIETCKLAIVDAEQRYSKDSLPGLWGYAFDLLVDNRKVSLAKKEEEAIIQELEDKLKRLTTDLEGQKIDPWAAEAAAKRLAKYYRKNKKDQDVRRVILKIGKAFADIENDGSSMQISGWLEQLRHLYIEFNLKKEAEAILLRIREIGPKVAAELKPISHSFEIPKEKLDEYTKDILFGNIHDVLTRIVLAYIPKKEEVKEQIFSLSKSSPLLYHMSHQIQDEKGRVIATIGSLKDDLEGHIVRQVSQNLSFSQIFLRHLIKEAILQNELCKEDILKFLESSPVIFPERIRIIDRGVEAYFEKDYLVSIHLLIPQIEESIRNLVELSGGLVLKTSRQGGYQLRTLDDLLRDPLIEKILGEDWATYFRILFTDQRGWNLRNKDCHGMTNPNEFDSEVADRVIHALLSLGLLIKGDES